MPHEISRHAPLQQMLAEMLHALQLPPELAAKLRIAGDEELPSCFPVTDLAVGSIAAAALALSALLGVDGKTPLVRVDRHLASAWFTGSLRPQGWELPAPWDPIAGDYRTADGWIRLHTNATHHRAVALAVLGCVAERDAVTQGVARWTADELEAAIVDVGGCAAAMRSQTAWRDHKQGRAVAAEPLVTITRIVASTRTPWHPAAARPLAGVKVLDLTRVLAGPVATRLLAGLGANVLRIDPPGWDEPGVVPEVTLGKRCARLDFHRPADRRRFEALLAEADIIVHGYRPGALARLSYDEAQRRSINPSLIDVSLCAYGWHGPWAQRRGFDSLVQMSSGIADAGMHWQCAEQPVPLPVQALDHATGYLMAAAAIRGLIARLRDAKAVTAKLSLARTAALLMESRNPSIYGPPFSGLSDTDYADGMEATTWGAALRLRPPVMVGNSTLYWDLPASALRTSHASW